MKKENEAIMTEEIEEGAVMESAEMEQTEAPVVGEDDVDVLETMSQGKLWRPWRPLWTKRSLMRMRTPPPLTRLLGGVPGALVPFLSASLRATAILR